MVVRIALVCGLLSLPLTAAAEPRLRWEAPRQCPQLGDARAEIARLLGKSWGELESELQVGVSIGMVGAAFESRVRVGRGAERVLTDPDCAVLGKAVAVVVALAIDPQRAEATVLPAAAASGAPTVTAPPAAPEAPTSPAAAASTAATVSASTAETLPTAATTEAESTTTTTEPAPAEAAVQEEPQPSAASQEEEAEEPAEEEDDGTTEAAALGFAFSLGGAMTVGVLPQVAPGAVGSFGVLGEGWRADIRVSYAFPQSGRLPPPSPDVGGSVGLAALALDAGPRFRWGWFEVPVVGGVELGLFEARAEQVSDPADPQHPVWLSTYLGAGLALPWGDNFALGLRVEGLVALLRPSFAVEPKQQEPLVFYQPAPVGARAFLELELRLP